MGLTLSIQFFGNQQLEKIYHEKQHGQNGGSLIVDSNGAVLTTLISLEKINGADVWIAKKCLQCIDTLS